VVDELAANPVRDHDRPVHLGGPEPQHPPPGRGEVRLPVQVPQRPRRIPPGTGAPFRRLRRYCGGRANRIEQFGRPLMTCSATLDDR